MKVKTILLASAAALCFSGSASALDLKNPFSGAAKHQFVSETEIEFGRSELKNHGGHSEDLILMETVTFGVTDKMSVFGKIANEFDVDGEYNNDHNFGYEVGASYSVQYNNLYGYVHGSYMTFDPQDFYGSQADGNWYKELEGEIRLGYDLGNGLMPYMTYTLSGEIDTGDRTLDQSLFAGVHKACDKWAVDGGLVYDYETDGKNHNVVSAKLSTTYYARENVALTVYGDYFLGGNMYDEYDGVAHDLDIDYTIGASVKVAF